MDIDMIIDESSDLDPDSVSRSVSVISSTPHGAAPFYRDVGLQRLTPEDTSRFAKANFMEDIMDQIATWDDRVKLTGIEFEDDNTIRMVITDGND